MIGAVKTHTHPSGLLAELDALGLAPGSWVATDADGTLWGADVADVAWQRVLSEKLLRSAACDALERLAAASGAAPTGDPYAAAHALYALYMNGAIGDGPLIEAMCVCYAGWSEAEVRAFGEDLYRRQIATRVYETTLPLLEGIAARGLRLAVVSGSPRLLVETCVRALGVQATVCGTASHPVDGVLDARMVEPITWEEGKVAALEAAQEGAPIAVAFGDTEGDWALLDAATTLAVLVHPRPGLRRRALQREEAGRGRWCVLAPPKTVGGHTVRVPESDRPLAQA